LEKILEYGLKGKLERVPSTDTLSNSDKGIFSTTYYWNYIENLTSCLPGPEASSVIKRVKELNKGAVGNASLSPSKYSMDDIPSLKEEDESLFD
jgi:hypothetical protein